MTTTLRCIGSAACATADSQTSSNESWVAPYTAAKPSTPLRSSLRRVTPPDPGRPSLQPVSASAGMGSSESGLRSETALSERAQSAHLSAWISLWIVISHHLCVGACEHERAQHDLAGDAVLAGLGGGAVGVVLDGRARARAHPGRADGAERAVECLCRGLGRDVDDLGRRSVGRVADD